MEIYCVLELEESTKYTCVASARSRVVKKKQSNARVNAVWKFTLGASKMEVVDNVNTISNNHKVSPSELTILVHLTNSYVCNTLFLLSRLCFHFRGFKNNGGIFSGFHNIPLGIKE